MWYCCIECGKVKSFDKLVNSLQYSSWGHGTCKIFLSEIIYPTNGLLQRNGGFKIYGIVINKTLNNMFDQIPETDNKQV